MDWTKLPDVGAVALLACAFASVARRNHTHVSRIWLTAWVMVALHFAACMFMSTSGAWGELATVMGLASLTWAGTLFMFASIPYRKDISSYWILAALLAANTIYVSILVVYPGIFWALILTAALFGVLPLSIAVAARHTINQPLRWVTVGLYLALSVFLLIFQSRPGNGSDLALNAVLFVVFFGCGIHFWRMYRRATAGAFITIAGFFAWASVFVVAPVLGTVLPRIQIESEVWNLPKYVVAVGMILLLLENQIEHNKYLALHDELTGLPNRRLFQDRLASALERARRTRTQTALLVVDLDRFKTVNDTFGHHAGDLLLQHAATIFAGRIRRSDTVARTGGDEFSLILEEPTSRADANRVGRSLLKLLQEPVQLEDRLVQIGASVGIAVYPEDALDMESLCIAADLRMYDEKHMSAEFGDEDGLEVANSLSMLESNEERSLHFTQ